MYGSGILEHISPFWDYQIPIRSSQGFIRDVLLLLRLPRPSSFWLFIWGWIYSVSLEALVGTSFWLPSRLLLSWGQLIDDVGFTLWLCIRYSHWGISPIFWDSYLLLDGMTIFIHGYRDVWLFLTDSLLCIRLSTLGHIPLSLMRLCLDSGTRMDDHC